MLHATRQDKSPILAIVDNFLHVGLSNIAIHELAHVMSDSIGHTKEFWDNFKFLLKKAVENNLYKPINYGKKSKMYCGMEINDNPYFDKDVQKDLSIEKENKWTI